MERWTTRAGYESLMSPVRLDAHAVNASSRSIKGLAVNWSSLINDQYGGMTRFKQGAFQEAIASLDSKFVKLFASHEDAIGLIVEAKETLNGLEVVGKVSRTLRGDEALTLASDGVWGALSVGFDALEFQYVTDAQQQTVRLISKAALYEVSLCEWGRDSAARVDEVYGRHQAARRSYSIAEMEALVRQYGRQAPAPMPSPVRSIFGPDTSIVVGRALTDSEKAKRAEYAMDHDLREADRRRILRERQATEAAYVEARRGWGH